jgi:transaldolase
MGLTVVFPMAGEGSRFGFRFKPFLEADGGRTFIERAKAAFDAVAGSRRFVFVVTEAQQRAHGVRERLRAMFPADRVVVHELASATRGPLETLRAAVLALGLGGPAFVCDCDHAVGLEPVLEAVEREPGVDCVVPTWDIDVAAVGHEWGKVRADRAGRALDFCEKGAMPPGAGAGAGEGTVCGLVGCTYLREVADVWLAADGPDLSGLYRAMLRAGRAVRAVPLERADFFGTPAQLDAHRRRSACATAFVDLDGTLVRHNAGEALPGSAARLAAWRRAGHRVVLTTAAGEARARSVAAAAGLEFDVLVSGLPPGPRVLINDRKPHAPLQPAAVALAVERDAGLPRRVAALDGCGAAHDAVLETLSAGRSGATTLRVRRADDGAVVVRKAAFAAHGDAGEAGDAGEGEGEGGGVLACAAAVLARQAADLVRLHAAAPSLFPRVLRSGALPGGGFFYDLEHLEGHRALSAAGEDAQQLLLPRVVARLAAEVYCFRRPLARRAEWLRDYVERKVAPRLPPGGADGPLLRRAWTRWADALAPRCEAVVHGDLTLDNILADAAGDVKLVDPSGAEPFDAPELDLGRLLVSLLAGYSGGAFADRCPLDDDDGDDGEAPVLARASSEGVAHAHDHAHEHAHVLHHHSCSFNDWADALPAAGTCGPLAVPARVAPLLPVYCQAACCAGQGAGAGAGQGAGAGAGEGEGEGEGEGQGGGAGAERAMFVRGVFFMGTILLRMVRYLARVSPEAAARSACLAHRALVRVDRECEAAATLAAADERAARALARARAPPPALAAEDVRRIKVFYDGAAIARYGPLPQVRGFTTNPSILRQAGALDYAAFVAEHAATVGPARPLSLQVGADDDERILADARSIVELGVRHAVRATVKLPILKTSGALNVPAIHRLLLAGVRLNVTAVFTPGHVDALADAFEDAGNGVMAHADVVVSVFAGRIADTLRDPAQVAGYAVSRLAPFETVQVLWAGCKDVAGVREAIRCGCHIVTVPDAVLDRLARAGKDLDEYARETAQGFQDDFQLNSLEACRTKKA